MTQGGRARVIRAFPTEELSPATLASVVEGKRAEIRRAAPDLPIEATRTMDEAVAPSVAQRALQLIWKSHPLTYTSDPQ